MEAHELGVVLSAPFQMKLGPEGSGREPDILFLAAERLDRLKDNHLDGAANLAVEIISPESRMRDRGNKFCEYEQAGVRKTWLIDPVRKQAEFYRLGEDGIYTAVPTGDGLYCSAVLPGLALELAWLWQEPLPRLLRVLRA